jgi:hypothetical protein
MIRDDFIGKRCFIVISTDTGVKLYYSNALIIELGNIITFKDSKTNKLISYSSDRILEMREE